MDVYIYDSLNISVSHKLTVQITLHYSLQADITPTIQEAHISNSQVGPFDCGLFALAYPFELAIGNSPEKFLFGQSKMRSHFQFYLENNRFVPVPKTSTNICNRHN